jgi:phytoene dehydrogenase-like protein
VVTVPGPLPESADAVVIGAGHNGLVAACYLAKAGLSVVVLEAADAPGGMSASGPLIPEAPGHTVNSGAAELLFLQRSTIPTDLDLARHGLRTVRSDPAYVYLHPDAGSLAYWRDPVRTAEEIARFSRRDAEAYLEFARLLDAILGFAGPYMLGHPLRVGPRVLAAIARNALRNARRLPSMVSLVAASGDALIEQTFAHPVVRDALYSLIGGVAPVSADGTALSAIFYAFLHTSGVLRPLGGMQAVPDTLAACLREHGGSVHTGAVVEEITVTGGRTTGVRLADGRTVTARRGVIAACDPRQTLTRLVPEGVLPERLTGRAATLAANATGNGWLKVDLALSGRVRLTEHERWRGDGLDLRKPAIMVGTMDGARRGYADAAAGLVPAQDDLLVWCFCPSGLDPSQAPDGQDVVYLSTPTTPLRPREGWPSVADKAVTGLLAQSARYYSGGLDLEIGRRVETPDSLADRLRVSNGCYFHVDFSLFRSGPFRPAPGLGGYRLPLPGLFLSGAGTHPGGGVSGMPGRLAALELLRS